MHNGMPVWRPRFHSGSGESWNARQQAQLRTAAQPKQTGSRVPTPNTNRTRSPLAAQDFVVGDNSSKELATGLFLEGIVIQNSRVRRAANEEEDTGHNDPESTLETNKWAGHGTEAVELRMAQLVRDPPHELLTRPAASGNEVFVSSATSQSYTERRRRRLVVVDDVLTSLDGPTPRAGLAPRTVASMAGQAGQAGAPVYAAAAAPANATFTSAQVAAALAAAAAVAPIPKPSAPPPPRRAVVIDSDEEDDVEPSLAPTHGTTAPPAGTPMHDSGTADSSMPAADPPPPAKRPKVGTSGAKLDGRQDERKNPYMCTCKDPTISLKKGRMHHAVGCMRSRWARDATLETVPAVGCKVQLMQSAGTKAGVWYKFIGPRWSECTAASPQS